MKRRDDRRDDALRTVTLERNYIPHAEGSVLISSGKTRVICTATVEEKVPSWLKDSGKGWVTAEYGMLPRSTQVRINREKSLSSGRSHEIQRLIGRSLRAVIDLGRLGERTIWIDCDVLEADGGTRTASINGAMIALADAVKHLREKKALQEGILTDFVAAISAGILEGRVLLDLDYLEDREAGVDMNIIMTGSGKMIEVQGTAEHEPFSRPQLEALLDLGALGIKEVIRLQKKTIHDDMPLLFTAAALESLHAAE
ncbi:MAG: ribonuclease PH [Candidatus Eremiobacteraeota bacterium]|nr:ribonuclease PH [Candidatus Eremiobacteraeota bacterium]